ncbi:3-oxoacyl-[acyl-carrier-protein] synthase 3 [Streptomyces xanthophaeus]|uniref:3-oxoacyl-ACP synthase III family protein n=1 Tax=Streptomyces xanthophaeus TaxID=67385 RepID=UPI00233E7FB7|nr:ketoacyl-ACP synthase III [Streptomyces xanthophaeus]WCD90929.1 3-oxoacyl-[acyl-carrier-protein] synthase 3 [Streptomyces xanthophaeus]
MAETVLCGLGGWLPPTVVDNEQMMAPATAAFVRRRIGVASRHRVTPGSATVHLATQAGRRALLSGGMSAVDALIVATTTPDRLCPAGAPEVASELGMTGIPAFDINAGCSGFLYACEVARGLIAGASTRSVLVIAAEAASAMVNPADPDTAPIFGDGAGAVVLRAARPAEAPTFGPGVWGSDGTRADIIAIPAGGARQRTPDVTGDELFLHLRGSEVLRHAVRRMSDAVRQAVNAAGWTLDDVDVLLAHQANAVITHAVAAALSFPAARMPSNIETVGNTAAASIPLLLSHAASEGTLKPGQRTVLVAFGSGLSWAATTCVWPENLNPRT